MPQPIASSRNLRGGMRVSPCYAAKPCGKREAGLAVLTDILLLSRSDFLVHGESAGQDRVCRRRHDTLSLSLSLAVRLAVAAGSHLLTLPCPRTLTPSASPSLPALDICVRRISRRAVSEAAIYMNPQLHNKSVAVCYRNRVPPAQLFIRRSADEGGPAGYDFS